MTVIGAGGVKIASISFTEKFKLEYKKLPSELQEQVNAALTDLLKQPMPRSLRFEKLSGYRKPNIFTIHVTANHSHKISLEIDGSAAILRRIGTHKQIDKNP